jgi:hypothetical protein
MLSGSDGESQMPCCFVMVTYTHQLGTILVQELLSSLLRGVSVRLTRIVCPLEQAETGLPTNIN